MKRNNEEEVPGPSKVLRKDEEDTPIIVLSSSDEETNATGDGVKVKPETTDGEETEEGSEEEAEEEDEEEADLDYSQVGWQRRSAFEGAVIEYTLVPNSVSDMTLTLLDQRYTMSQLIADELQSVKALKYCLVTRVLLVRETLDGDSETRPYFRTCARLSYPYDSVATHLGEDIMVLSERLANFTENGSNWSFRKLLYIMLQLVPTKVEVVGSFIPLPLELARTKSIINFQTNDDFCVKYCILAGKKLMDGTINTKHNICTRFYNLARFESEVNFLKVRFPCRISDLDRIERLNPDIALCVFSYEPCRENDEAYNPLFPFHVYPLRVSCHLDRKYLIDLLLITEGDKHHYALITNISRLFGHLRRRSKEGARVLCRRCMHFFISTKAWEQHYVLCREHKPQRVIMPKANKATLSFLNYGHQIKHPAICVFDIESLLEPMSEDSNIAGSITKLDRHVPIMLSFCILNEDRHFLYPLTVLSGRDCVVKFLRCLRNYYDQLQRDSHKKMIPLTIEEQQLFEQDDACCFLCKEPITDKHMRIRHHSHTSGRFVGLTCVVCNNRLRLQRNILAYALNARGYDNQFICRALKDVAQPHETVKVIGNSMEKFTAIWWGKMVRFADVSRLVSGSLESLTSQLPESSFVLLQKEFPNSRQRELLTGKLPFPYRYFTTDQCLDHTELPARKYFDNDLKDKPCSVEEYGRVESVWSEFKLTDLASLMSVYVRADVLQTADVLFTMRDSLFNLFGVDPCHSISLASYSYSLLLKQLKHPIQLIMDFDQLLFFRAAQYGGICQTTQRHVKRDATTKIDHYDATALYSSVSEGEYLPCGGFAWTDPNTVDIANYSRSQTTGYLLEIDCFYPPSVHDVLASVPPLPIRRQLNMAELSPHTQNVLRQLGLSKPPATERLILDLNPKTNYVAHIATLQQFLRLGGVITKYHRALKFQQGPILKEYIGFLGEQRSNAKTVLEANLFKELGNSAVGFLLINPFKFSEYYLVYNTDKLQELAQSPRFQRVDVFDDYAACVQWACRSVKMIHASFVSITVLTLAKVRVIDFFYDVIRGFHGLNAHALYCDTDSWVVRLDNCPDDKYEQYMHHMLPFLDTSNLDPSSPFYTTARRRQLGTWKNEAGSRFIIEVILLCPKSYMIVYNDCQTLKRAKGVYHTAKDKLTYDDFLQSYQAGIVKRSTSLNIRSFHHHLMTIKQTKIALGPLDLKRYWMTNNISLPFGHWRCTLIN